MTYFLFLFLTESWQLALIYKLSLPLRTTQMTFFFYFRTTQMTFYFIFILTESWQLALIYKLSLPLRTTQMTFFFISILTESW